MIDGAPCRHQGRRELDLQGIPLLPFPRRLVLLRASDGRTSVRFGTSPCLGDDDHPRINHQMDAGEPELQAFVDAVEQQQPLLCFRGRRGGGRAGHDGH